MNFQDLLLPYGNYQMLLFSLGYINTYDKKPRLFFISASGYLHFFIILIF